MDENNKHSSINFCDDSQLSYDKYKTNFKEEQELRFDDAYRLAHLPLVAPDHPLVIQTKPGTSYNRGVHDVIYSIAMPIHENELFSSAIFVRLCDDLKNSKFSYKLSWDTFSLRKNKLHATICGALSTGSAPHLEKRIYRKLRKIGPVSISVRGLFSGNINIGRLYLKVYPEMRGGKNMCHAIQNLFGSSETDLYVIGLFNFVDELNADETQELRNILDLWNDKEIIILRLEELWLLKSKDDLVLSGGIEKSIPIV